MYTPTTLTTDREAASSTRSRRTCSARTATCSVWTATLERSTSERRSTTRNQPATISQSPPRTWARHHRYQSQPRYQWLTSQALLTLYSAKIYTIRYDIAYLTCSKKLTCSQLSPPHGQTEKLKKKRTKKIESSKGSSTSYVSLRSSVKIIWHHHTCPRPTSTSRSNGARTASEIIEFASARRTSYKKVVAG